MKSSIQSKVFFFYLILSVLLGQDSTSSGSQKKIGPIIDDLPVLDSLIVVEKDSIRNDIIRKYNLPQTSNYPINASGTFFRG